MFGVFVVTDTLDSKPIQITSNAKIMHDVRGEICIF